MPAVDQHTRRETEISGEGAYQPCSNIVANWSNTHPNVYTVKQTSKTLIRWTSLSVMKTRYRSKSKMN